MSELIPDIIPEVKKPLESPDMENDENFEEDEEGEEGEEDYEEESSYKKKSRYKDVYKRRYREK
jgi:hypothetical protein